MAGAIRGGNRRAFLVPLALALALAAPPIGAQTSERVEAAREGAIHLASIQNDDGSFPHGDGAHNTAEGIWAITATGMGGPPIERALDHIDSTGVPQKCVEDDDGNQVCRRDAGEVGMVVMGLVAAGEDPADFRGTNYAATLDELYDETTGEFQANPQFPVSFFANVMGALGHLAIHGALPDEAIDYIDTHVCPDGGFGFGKNCDFGSDHDTTAYVLNVFAGAGRPMTDQVAEDARQYLLRGQNADGGFGFSPAFPETTADSTGVALTALAALDEEDADAVAALMDLQLDSGGFRRQTGDTDPNPWSTLNALAGLAGSSLPVQPVADPIPIEDPPPPGDDDEVDEDDEDNPPGQNDRTSRDTRGTGASTTGQQDNGSARVAVQDTTTTPRPVLPDTGPSEGVNSGARPVAAAIALLAVVTLTLAAGSRVRHEAR